MSLPAGRSREFKPLGSEDMSLRRVHTVAFSVRPNIFLRKAKPFGLRNVLSHKCWLSSEIYEWIFPTFVIVLNVGLKNRKKVTSKLKITGHCALGVTLKLCACCTHGVSLLLRNMGYFVSRVSKKCIAGRLWVGQTLRWLSIRSVLFY